MVSGKFSSSLLSLKPFKSRRRSTLLLTSCLSSRCIFAHILSAGGTIPFPLPQCDSDVSRTVTMQHCASMFNERENEGLGSQLWRSETPLSVEETRDPRCS
ncbi:hypothetical protein DL98DRAFT_156652 [Cadophora sp. DSE1049]|nr:hypothetical protein DL98DRAFT_156652 [Cadophora sp. DSE1049]